MLQNPNVQTKTMKQTLRNPLDAVAFGAPNPILPYASLPAKYAGNPNYLKYRQGNGSDLAEADLADSDLRWSNFRSTNLRRARFVGSVAWGSAFTNADLSNADLSHADFTGTDLVGTDLSNAKTEGACFTGARYSPSTRFPSGFGNPETKGLVGLNESMQLSQPS